MLQKSQELEDAPKPQPPQTIAAAQVSPTLVLHKMMPPFIRPPSERS